jgi:hypothetical protein
LGLDIKIQSKGESDMIAYIDDRSSSAIKIWVAPYKSDADLCVFVAKYKSDAKGKDGVWFFEKNKSSSTVTIKQVKYKTDAHLKIYYVNYKSEAGWRKSHPLRGRLG